MKKPAVLVISGLAVTALFLVLVVYHGPGFPIHIPMRALFFVSCLAALFIVLSVMYSQTEPPAPGRPGFAGPGANPPPPPPFGGPGFNPPPPSPPFGSPGCNPPPPPPPGFQGAQAQYGFTGPSKTSTAAQAAGFGHRAPVILSGNLVQSIGPDLYTFRDSSGDIAVRIGPLEWQNAGFNISPSDAVEISGEVHRDMEGFQRPPEVRARHIRKI